MTLTLPRGHFRTVRRGNRDPVRPALRGGGQGVPDRSGLHRHDGRGQRSAGDAQGGRPTDETSEAERLRRETALTTAEIAEAVGLGYKGVGDHLAAHVPFTPEMRARIRARQNERRYAERDAAICARRRQGAALAEIASEFGMHRSRVAQIVSGSGTNS